MIRGGYVFESGLFKGILDDNCMNLNKGLNELARRYEETRSKEDKEKLDEYNKGRDEAKQQADAAEKSSNDTKSTYNV